MIFSSLASGSSGNCFFIGENKKTGILIDAGISCKQIAERLNSFSIIPQAIKAIFITHEHTDHIKGAEVFSNKFKVPIFATKETLERLPDTLQLNPINKDETTKIFELEIRTFPKSHQAKNPVSYQISGGNKRISIITDAGYCCKNIVEATKDSNLLCLESNHDIQMLEQGPYPWHIKKWIKSDTGHLSNLQAGINVIENASSKLKHLILAHLSQTNNIPQLAIKSMENLIKERNDLKPKLDISTRERPTNLIRI